MALRLLQNSKKHEFKWLPVGVIVKNPNQPRRVFDEQGLRELSESIARYGVITPLTVRRVGGGYELIAGERRLRASIMAGLEAVPCYLVQAEEVDSSLMALVENLQRRDLDFFEEAQGLRRLTELYGMTQEQAAQRVGKSQSAVANKLRLLRLSAETVCYIRESGLTERHARALLRLTNDSAQLAAAKYIVSRGLNVEQAEIYIDKLMALHPTTPMARRKGFVRDIRLFLNTVDRAVTAMQTAGVGVCVDKQDLDDEVVLTIHLPRGAKSPTVGAV